MFDTGLVLAQVPTWHCQCPIGKVHLAVSIFIVGMSSENVWPCKAKRKSPPKDQPHCKASTIMSKKCIVHPNHSTDLGIRHHRNRSAML